MKLKQTGYHPYAYLNDNPLLQEVFNFIRSGMFSNGDGGLFTALLENLIGHDPYLVLADFQSYLECQEQVNQAYQDPTEWTRMSILNAARSGKFSSDRSIREYCKDIWKVKPVSIKLLNVEDVKAELAS